jgi:hypothetical protein
MPAREAGDNVKPGGSLRGLLDPTLSLPGFAA